MRKVDDGEEKKKKRMTFLVATTSLPAVYRPNGYARTTTAGTTHARANSNSFKEYQINCYRPIRMNSYNNKDHNNNNFFYNKAASIYLSFDFIVISLVFSNG